MRVYASVVEELFEDAWSRVSNGRPPSRLTKDLMDRFVEEAQKALDGRKAKILEVGDWWITISFRRRKILVEYDFEENAWFAEVVS